MKTIISYNIDEHYHPEGMFCARTKIGYELFIKHGNSFDEAKLRLIEDIKSKFLIYQIQIPPDEEIEIDEKMINHI